MRSLIFFFCVLPHVQTVSVWLPQIYPFRHVPGTQEKIARMTRVNLPLCLKATKKLLPIVFSLFSRTFFVNSEIHFTIVFIRRISAPLFYNAYIRWRHLAENTGCSPTWWRLTFSCASGHMYSIYCSPLQWFSHLVQDKVSP